jgi:hypothetical protein
MQFCTPGWLPKMSEERLIKLRSFFCKLNEDGKLAMTKEEFYKQVSRNELKYLLREVVKAGLTGVRRIIQRDEQSTHPCLLNE